MLQPIAQLAQEDEAPAHPFGFGGKQRQRHQTTHAQRGKHGQLLDETRHILGIQAIFAGLARGIDLHEHVQRPPLSLQMPVQRLCHAQAVQCLELAGKTCHQPGLVGLQVADDRPAQIGQVLHGLPFPKRFLYLVLAQQAAARCIGQTQAGLRLGLADGQQAHTGWITPHALAGSCNALLHGGEVAKKVLYRAGLGVQAMLIVTGRGF